MPICKVTFDGYSWRNIVTVTSPTGRTIRLRANWSDYVSTDAKALFSELNSAWIANGDKFITTERDLPIHLMHELNNLSKRRYT